MKKNRTYGLMENIGLLKMIKIMHFTIFILFLSLSQAFAVNSYSQQTKLSLDLKNAKVEDVLDQIEKKSEFFFMYNKGMVDVERKIDIQVEEKGINQVLDKVFEHTGISYSIKNRQILLINNSMINNAVENITQQQKSISGKVTDSSGGSLPGVSVVVKGTTTGVITDGDGKYSLSNVPENAILQYSFVGMKGQEIAVGSRTSINVTLAEDNIGIDEVVAIGYGTMKKSDLTGSIVSVKSEDIKNLPVRSVTEALQGRIAGVMVNKSSGRPGAGSEIIIRGVGSLNGLNPLYIIDGVPADGSPVFNQKDVESIEVIKDASAAAIYGSRAAGGVVLITTKLGNYNTKSKFEITTNTGIREISKKYEFLSTEDFIRARRGIGEDYAHWSDPKSLPNTDWFNEVFEPGLEQSYQITSSGGTEKIRYYMSGAYDREDGIQKANFWERYSARFNANYKLSDKVTLKHNLYLARINENPATLNVPWRTLPYMPVYNPDGTFAKVPNETSGGNDVATLAYQHNKNKSFDINANLSADWKITNDLVFTVTGSGRLNSSYADQFSEADITRRAPTPASYNKSSNIRESYVLNAFATYSKRLMDKHNIRLMAGYEIQQSDQSWLQASADQFPVNVAESFALSTNPNKKANGSLVYGRSLSQFARFNYDFNNRYLLTANIRRDGSPKFGPSTRWGVFPSVSAGWKLNEESFFKDLDWSFVDLIKPRLSWGILGSDAAIGNFAWQPAYKQLTLHSFDEVNAVGGFNITKIVNEAIKWEEIQSTNAGVDISMFDNKLAISAEYYSRQTNDMLYYLPIPLSSGISERRNNTSTMPVNIGSISNKGWEFSISYRNQIGDLKYNVSGNLSNNVNKVTDLGIQNAFIYSGSSEFMSGNSPFKTENGLPIGQIYGLIVDGLFTAQSEIDALNAKATEKDLAAGIIKTGAVSYYNNKYTGPGDLKYRDINNDGKITDLDRTYIGNPWPKYQYGANILLEYKGFDFSAQIVGVEGRDVFNGVKSFQQYFQQDYQSTPEIFNASFFLDNGLTNQPRLGMWDPANPKLYIKDPNRNFGNYSSYYVEDGSYLKIKNIALGYSLPESILNRMKLSKLRILLSGQNLFTFTKFTGLDPEFTNNVKNHGLYTKEYYPQTKLYSIGLEMGF